MMHYYIDKFFLNSHKQISIDFGTSCFTLARSNNNNNMHVIPAKLDTNWK